MSTHKWKHVDRGVTWCGRILSSPGSGVPCAECAYLAAHARAPEPDVCSDQPEYDICVEVDGVAYLVQGKVDLRYALRLALEKAGLGEDEDTLTQQLKDSLRKLGVDV